MDKARTLTLYRKDGMSVRATEVRADPRRRLVDHLVTDDGRVVICQDENRGVFWFQDTEEKLFRGRPCQL